MPLIHILNLETIRRYGGKSRTRNTCRIKKRTVSEIERIHTDERKVDRVMRMTRISGVAKRYLPIVIRARMEAMYC